MPLMTETSRGGAPLMGAKTRAVITAAAAAAALCGVVLVRAALDPAVKIAALYLVTVSGMALVTARKNYLDKHEVGIFCFLLIALASLAPPVDKMDTLATTAYVLSYRYGVSSRGLIATVVDFLCGGFISKYFVWHFILCATLVLSFLVSLFIGLVIRTSPAAGGVKPFVLALSLFFLTGFTGPLTYFGEANFGWPELFGFLFSLCALAALKRPLLRWTIPFLALFALAAHIILVFFYVPFIVIILFRGLTTGDGEDKGGVPLFAVTAAVIAAAFLLYLFFHEGTFVFRDPGSMAEYLRRKTDLPFTENWLRMTLFAKLGDHVAGRNTSLLFKGNLSVLINLPFLAAFVVFWVNCFRRETRAAAKFFFALPALLLVYQGAVFFMFIDYGRWMTMIMNIQYMFLFYLLYVRDEIVISVAERTVPFISRNWFMCALVCALTASLGPVQEIGASSRVAWIVKGMLTAAGIPW